MLRLSRHSAWVVLCAAMGPGCSDNDPIPEEEVPVLKTQVTDLQVPTLLLGQSVTVDGQRRELGFDDFEDSEAAEIEIHEISPQADDGTYTATVSFNLQLGEESMGTQLRTVRPKVEITYDTRNATISTGDIILIHQVHNVKMLSVEPGRTAKKKKKRN